MLEFQLTHRSISTIHLWLTALLGVSFLLTVLFLMRFVSARFVLGPKYDRFSKVLLAVLASVQIFAWQLYLYCSTHDTVALWCFPVAFFGGVIVWRVTKGPLPNELHNESLTARRMGLNSLLVRTLPVAIFVISLCELAGFAQATRHFSEATSLDGAGEPLCNLYVPGKLIEKSSICGTTDRGNPIKLFERQITTSAFQDHLQKCRSLFATMSERAMLRAHPFVQSNCHGWVFTDGQHILKGEDVQVILNDNNYCEVAKPQANDVVVYRNNAGDIIHTGIVRGALEGAILVESKWGMGALYMHVAEEQPYSQYITYYRTNRPTHVIAIAPTGPGDELLTDQSVDDRVKRSAFDTHLCSSQSK